ncbi:MAG TPA: ADP-ribosylation factor-like protein [Thermoanaerobaculia bacterium]|nr:ADP-ribosylation factor-like protein [Thermoanaerobaculia bacterium]
MALYNAATKELTAKIVYYGPGLGGKTTNLQLLHDRLDQDTVGKLLTPSAQTDRTVHFDLLPVDLGEIKGYKIRFQLATVPGHPAFNETRKAVLGGADGVVFVADSRWAMLPENQESWQNLKDNLQEIGLSFETIPIVVQYNKRDLPEILSVGAMQEALGLASYPFAEAVASTGRGVTETFKLISKLTFVDLLRRLQGRKAEEAGVSDLSTPLPAFSSGGAAEPPPGFEVSGPPAAEGFARTTDSERLAALEARLAAIEERMAGEPDELRRLAESSEESAEKLSAAETRLAAIEERLAREAEGHQRLVESAAEIVERLAATESRIASISERLASEAEEHRRPEESSVETAGRLAAIENRLEAGDAALRNAQQAAAAALESLGDRAEKLSWERAENLTRQIDALSGRTEALETGLQEKAAQSGREAEEIRSRIAPLLEAQAEMRASDRQSLAELDRLREALADSLAEISERVRRAVGER